MHRLLVSLVAAVAVFSTGLVGRTPPSSQYHARLILRGGDGALLIRNQFGDEIWRFC